MRSLFRKEFRSLRPFLALVLFFVALNWVFLFLSEFPDQYPLSKLLSDDNRGSTQLMMFIVALALAAGLIVRERDEGTLAFLDALPVSRAQVFGVKFALALGVLWVLPASDLIFNATIYSWSRTSLDARFHWDMLVTAAALDAASCFVYLALGLVLSFLGRFSLLVLGLLIWTYLLLQEVHVPFVPLLNIFTLGDPVFHGQCWLVPTAQLATQLALGLACLGAAFAGFLALGDVTQRLADRVQRRRGSVVLAGLATLVIAVTWIGLVVYWAQKTRGNEDAPQVHYASWQLSRATTVRYQFLYPENQAGFVRQLLDRADAAEARVREFLGAPPVPSIVADLSGSGPHSAGQAHWKKIQIDLASAEGSAENLVAVLAHETTHVHLDHLSQGRISDDFNSTRFFHEGLATYLEYHDFRSTNALAGLRRVAAVARARNEVKLEEMLDDVALARQRDADLVYPLGEVFVAALIRRYGDPAPGKVVRAFGRDKAPKGLKGSALWEDTLQACGYNWSDVVEAFFAELDRGVTDQRAFIDSLPRLRGAVQRTPARIGIRAVYEGKAPGTVVCRFRPRADTPDRLYEEPSTLDGKLFRVDRTGYPDRSFWYQLGWLVPNCPQVIYEPWVEVRQDR